MIVDGKAISEDLKRSFRERLLCCGRQPRLAIVTEKPTPVTRKYLAAKKKFASEIGIKVRLARVRDIPALNGDSTVSGIIVQLPLPVQYNVDRVLASIAPEKDVDALGSHSKFLSPVVLAVEEILSNLQSSIFNFQTAVVVGKGRLVGKPVAGWLRREGVKVQVIGKGEKIPKADLVVLGAGVPGLLTPKMVKEGAVVIDAGASESGGHTLGDADPACEKKCALFTPVPGGVGPVAVAKLFENLLHSVLC